MPNYFAEWPACWSRKGFRVRFALTALLTAVTLYTLPRFLAWVEIRPGVVLPDPIHRLFPPVDLTWVIFSLIYGCLALAIVTLVRDPERLLIAFQSYSLLVWFRIGAMYLVPLEPPAVTIPLQDPFVQLFGSGHVLMKDLFFSGHTSTLFLLFLLARGRRLRAFFLLAVIAVAIAIIIHHTHYTIDVYVAPFFSYASYRIITLLNSRVVR